MRNATAEALTIELVDKASIERVVSMTRERTEGNVKSNSQTAKAGTDMLVAKPICDVAGLEEDIARVVTRIKEEVASIEL